jgi:hypothetical protein
MLYQYHGECKVSHNEYFQQKSCNVVSLYIFNRRKTQYTSYKRFPGKGEIQHQKHSIQVIKDFRDSETIADFMSIKGEGLDQTFDSKSL